MDKDLLSKMLLSLLLVHFYDKESSKDGEESKLEEIRDFKLADDNKLFEDILLRILTKSKVSEETLSNVHMRSIDKQEYNFVSKNTNELGQNYTRKNESEANPVARVKSKVLNSKTIPNHLYQIGSKTNRDEDKLGDSKKISKIADVYLLIAILKMPIPINEVITLKSDKVYKVEELSFDIKSLKGNLLVLGKSQNDVKVKFFYEGIIRVKAKLLCIDHISDGKLFCNTKDIISYLNVNGSVNTKIEQRFIDGINSINIPIDIDLVSSEFSVKALLEQSTTLFDVKEEYYKAFRVIGFLYTELALLTDQYAMI